MSEAAPVTSIVGGKYTRDTKLRVLEHYFRNGGNVFGNKQATANHFGLDSKTVFRFLQVPELVQLARRRARTRRSAAGDTDLDDTGGVTSRTTANSTGAHGSNHSGSNYTSSVHCRSPAGWGTGEFLRRVPSSRNSPAAGSWGCGGGDPDSPLSRLTELSEADIESSQLPQSAVDNFSNVFQLIQAFDIATDELRDILLYECQLIYECRVCSALFRNLAQLVTHKRRFCSARHVDTRPMRRSATATGSGVCSKPSVCVPGSARGDGDTVPSAAGGGGGSTVGASLLQPRVVLEPVDGSRVAVFQTRQTCDGSDAAAAEAAAEGWDGGSGDVGTSGAGADGGGAGATRCLSDLDSLRCSVADGSTVCLGADGKIIDLSGVPDISDEAIVAALNPLIAADRHVCSHCNTEFSSRKTLSQHVRSLHSSTRVYFPCPCCSATFSSLFSLERHLQKVHKKKQDELRSLKEQGRARSFVRPVNADESGSCFLSIDLPTAAGGASSADPAAASSTSPHSTGLTAPVTAAAGGGGVHRASDRDGVLSAESCKKTHFEWKCRVCDARFERLSPALEHVAATGDGKCGGAPPEDATSSAGGGATTAAARSRLVRVCRFVRVDLLAHWLLTPADTRSTDQCPDQQQPQEQEEAGGDGVVAAGAANGGDNCGAGERVQCCVCWRQFDGTAEARQHLLVHSCAQLERLCRQRMTSSLVDQGADGDSATATALRAIFNEYELAAAANRCDGEEHETETDRTGEERYDEEMVEDMETMEEDASGDHAMRKIHCADRVQASCTGPPDLVFADEMGSDTTCGQTAAESHPTTTNATHNLYAHHRHQQQQQQRESQNLVLPSHCRELLSVAGKGFPVTWINADTVTLDHFVVFDCDAVVTSDGAAAAARGDGCGGGFVCTLCETVFASGEAAGRHMQSYHGPAVLRAYVDRHGTHGRLAVPKPCAAPTVASTPSAALSRSENIGDNEDDGSVPQETGRGRRTALPNAEMDPDIEAGAKLLVSCRLWSPAETRRLAPSGPLQAVNGRAALTAAPHRSEIDNIEEREEEGQTNSGSVAHSAAAATASVHSTMMLIDGQSFNRWDVMRRVAGTLMCALCRRRFIGLKACEHHLRDAHSGADIAHHLATSGRMRPVVAACVSLTATSATATRPATATAVSSTKAPEPAGSLSANTRVLKISRSDLIQPCAVVDDDAPPSQQLSSSARAAVECLVCQHRFADRPAATDHMRGHSDAEIRDLIRARGRQLLPLLERRSLVAVAGVGTGGGVADSGSDSSRPATGAAAVAVTPTGVKKKSVVAKDSAAAADSGADAADVDDRELLLVPSERGTDCLVCQRSFKRYSSAFGHLKYHSEHNLRRWRQSEAGKAVAAAAAAAPAAAAAAASPAATTSGRLKAEADTQNGSHAMANSIGNNGNSDAGVVAAATVAPSTGRVYKHQRRSLDSLAGKLVARAAQASLAPAAGGDICQSSAAAAAAAGGAAGGAATVSGQDEIGVSECDVAVSGTLDAERRSLAVPSVGHDQSEPLLSAVRPNESPMELAVLASDAAPQSAAAASTNNNNNNTATPSPSTGVATTAVTKATVAGAAVAPPAVVKPARVGLKVATVPFPSALTAGVSSSRRQSSGVTSNHHRASPQQDQQQRVSASQSANVAGPAVNSDSLTVGAGAGDPVKPLPRMLKLGRQAGSSGGTTSTTVTTTTSSSGTDEAAGRRICFDSVLSPPPVAGRLKVATTGGGGPCSGVARSVAGDATSWDSGTSVATEARVASPRRDTVSSTSPQARPPPLLRAPQMQPLSVSLKATAGRSASGLFVTAAAGTGGVTTAAGTGPLQVSTASLALPPPRPGRQRLSFVPETGRQPAARETASPPLSSASVVPTAVASLVAVASPPVKLSYLPPSQSQTLIRAAEPGPRAARRSSPSCDSGVVGLNRSGPVPVKRARTLSSGGGGGAMPAAAAAVPAGPAVKRVSTGALVSTPARRSASVSRSLDTVNCRRNSPVTASSVSATAAACSWSPATSSTVSPSDSSRATSSLHSSPTASVSSAAGTSSSSAAAPAKTRSRTEAELALNSRRTRRTSIVTGTAADR